jgi:uncharacterized protein (TIGR02147 family)
VTTTQVDASANAGSSAAPREMPRIFEHASFGAYFGAVITHLREQSKVPVSLRALAKRLGVRSPSLLHMIAQGTRRAQPELVSKVCEYLGLSEAEREYAAALAELERAKSAAVQHGVVAKLRRLRPTNSELMLALDAFSLIGRWFHFTILELLALDRFREDPDRIATYLGGGVEAEAVKDSLAMLERLGLARRDASGRLRKSAEKVRTAVPPKSTLAIRVFHKQMLMRATRAIDQQSLTERYVTSLTIPVPVARLAEASRRIAEFRDAFAREMAAAKDGGEEVYHLNMQFFRATEERAFPPS